MLSLFSRMIKFDDQNNAPGTDGAWRIAVRIGGVNSPTSILRRLLLPILVLGLLCAEALGAERLRFDHLTLDDGLPQVSVSSILQDLDGFIWIVTQDGVARWDGYDMVVYRHDPADSESLSSNLFNGGHMDRDGRLWLMNQQVNSVDVLDPRSGRARRLVADGSPDGLRRGGVSPSVFYDDGAAVWLRWNLLDGTAAGIEKIDKASGRVTHLLPDPGDPAARPDAILWQILETRDGEVWLATLRGLARRVTGPGETPERFELYRPETGQPDDVTAVTALAEAADGTLWVGTWGGGLQRFDPARGVFERPPQAPIGDLAATNWIIPAPGPASPSLVVDPTGVVWAILGQGGGVGRWIPGGGADGDGWRVEHRAASTGEPEDGALSSNQALGIYLDSAGFVWIGTNGGGLNRWRPESGDFLTLRHDSADPKSLGGDVVRAFLVDRSGLLWFGVTPNGVSRFSHAKHRFRHLRRPTEAPPGLRENMAYCVFVDRRGELWMGTLSSGVYRFDASRREVVERYHAAPGDPRDIGADFVRMLAEDDRGRIWIGTMGAGLAEVDPERGVVLRRIGADRADPRRLTNPNVFGLDRARDGLLWVSTANGLNLFDPRRGEVVERYLNDPEDPTSLPVNFTRLTYEDPLGRIWVAGTGLHRFDRERKIFTASFHNPADPTSLSNDNVLAVYMAEDERLWVATYGGGLDLFDPASGVFEHLRQADGLPSDTVYSLLPDDAGHLWLSTNNGLSRFDPGARTFENYGKGHGLPSREFNGRSYFKTPGGELLFGTTDGVVSFDPRQIRPSPEPPPVVLTEIRVFDQPLDPGTPLAELERLELSYKDRFFAFELAALDYTEPSANRYAYRLEGFDRDWVESGTRRYVSYTNLDGGRYTFRFRGSTYDGVWTSGERSIEIVVVPPWWKTWWAYTLYGLALVAGVGGYSRQRTRRHRAEIRAHLEETRRQREMADHLRRVDRLKDEFLANTSHELRTPLNGIIGIAESLLDGAGGKLAEAARGNLFMIASSGRRLAHLVDDILDFSKLKNRQIELHRRPVGVHEAVEIVLTLSAPLVAGKELALRNAVPVDLSPVEADENRLQQILHNLIGNAIKFTDAGEIEITAAATDGATTDGATAEGMVEIRVRDTGLGIPADKLATVFESFEQVDGSAARAHGGTGLGLTITRQLVELHGGAVDIASTLGQGTEVTVRLPRWTGEALPDEPSRTARRLSRVRDLGPIAETMERGERVEPGASPPSAAGGADRPRVLIVDDEPVNLQVLENILGMAGYEVVRAGGGERALEILGSEEVDLVLLDVMMPRITGFEVCRRLRKSHSPNSLPIVLLTAKNQVSDLMEGLASGANDYLTKPFSKDELLARIRTHLSLSRAASAEADNRRRAEELEQARRIQLSMLPQSPPRLADYEIVAHMQTATEVGGDYYDFFPQEDGSFYVVTGDATGHGIPAGMMVSMTKSALRAIEVKAPHASLAHLNRVLRAVHLERLQMALNAVYIHGGEVAFSSAGMPPILLYRAATAEVEELLIQGLPLGSLEEAEFRLEIRHLDPGDVLVLLSDGLPETRDAADEPLGYPALSECLARVGGGSVEEILTALRELGEGHAEGRPPDDDVTLVVLRRTA